MVEIDVLLQNHDSGMCLNFKLYEFDLSCDLVHILPLCIFKKYVKILKDACHGREVDLKNALVEVTSKRPSNVGSRWPMLIREQLGYWKANRVHTFYLFLFALCLKSHGIQQRWTIMHNGNFFDRNFPTILLSQLHNGWIEESMLVARELLASWRVWWEEYLGPNGSILEHVAGKLLQSSPFSVEQFWSSPWFMH